MTRTPVNWSTGDRETETSCPTRGAGPRLTLRLVKKEPIADSVALLELAAADDSELPRWEPGAHLEFRLPSGRVRQYSLCGDPADRYSYTVAVLRVRDGRGGSTEVHDAIDVGTEIDSSAPRNHFALADAPDYVLVAGGIGVTPIKPMLDELTRRGAPWRLFYGGRTRRSMAFCDELERAHGDRVTLLPQDERGPPDVRGIVDSLSTGTVLYCCGPAPMLAAVTEVCTDARVSDRLHTERFEAGGDAVDTGADRAFDVELRRSGRSVRVAADQSVLDAVRAVRPDIESSCNEGYCGTCETRVIAGTPEHRGSLMSAQEHDDEGTMLICVGRASSAGLVLDL